MNQGHEIRSLVLNKVRGLKGSAAHLPPNFAQVTFPVGMGTNGTPRNHEGYPPYP